MNVAKRVLIFLSIINLTLPAQHKLVASDPGEDDYFGTSVAVSGDYAIVGSFYDDDAGVQSGSAYIFNRVPETGNWVQTAKLVASDAAASNQFGYSVDMHGDYAIVGAYGNSHPSYGMGAAYVFQKDAGGEDWIQRAKLIANDAAASDQFGISVALDLDYALVGASYDDEGFGESGSAYIFKRDSGLQSWTQQDKLTASNAAASASFGTSVELQGEYAIVSSHGSATESALIFKKDTGAETWTEQAILAAADWSAGDDFSYSVSISADYAVVGSRNDDDDPGDNAGSAYVYKRNTGLETWSQMTKLTASDQGLGGTFFGASVAILNKQIIIGAYQGGVGKAYLFDRATGEETWTETVILPQSSLTGTQHFGQSVDLSASFVICGAPYDDDTPGDNAGSAYIMDQSDFSLPVELSNFRACSKDNLVALDWLTSSEVENLGFILERSLGTIQGLDIEPVEVWEPIATYLSHPALRGQGSTTRETSYQFLDKAVTVGQSYTYRLSDVDYRGTVTALKTVSIVVLDAEANLRPGSFRVNAIYPNPFNPGTTISYTLDQSIHINAAILDLRGRTVKVLIHNQGYGPGSYSLYWDGTDMRGQHLESGLYFVHISSGFIVQTHKIILLD